MLPHYDVVSQMSGLQDRTARWTISCASGETTRIKLTPRLVSSDLRVQFEAETHGVGIALMPAPIVEALRNGPLEQVLPAWSATRHMIHPVYPPPRGMLPSARSLIGYLVVYMPSSLQKCKLAQLSPNRA
jgi:DNA-binding transcriptional LysR family regulator